MQALTDKTLQVLERVVIGLLCVLLFCTIRQYYILRSLKAVQIPEAQMQADREALQRQAQTFPYQPAR